MIKVIDNYLDNDLAEKLHELWPNENDNCWYKRSDLFQSNQYGCNKKELMPKFLSNF